MKRLIILFHLTIMVIFSYAQKKTPTSGKTNSNGFSIKVLNTLCENPKQLLDPNANRLYYTRYVISVKNKNTLDTIWAPLIGSDTMEINKWQYVFTAKDDVLWYIGKTPLNVEGKYITLWSRDWNYFSKKKVGNNINYHLLLSMVDCDKKKIKALKVYEFDYQGKSKEYSSNSDFEYAIPGSLGENIIKAVCDINK